MKVVNKIKVGSVCRNIHNIPSFIFLFSVHRLTWHQGKIPSSEVWVKLGGDKGGGSFKMSFQLCNVEHPNSPVNTCVFLIFEAPDNVTNLRLGLDPLQRQMDSLESMTWRYMT